MSFQPNNTKQMAIYDSLYNLTKKEVKYLKNSWVKTFSKTVFSFVDRETIMARLSKGTT